MNDGITLFDSAEDAWFWFIQANDARQDGARITANLGLYKRPREIMAARIWGEAMDILNDVFVTKDIVRPNLSAEIINFQMRKEAMQSW